MFPSFSHHFPIIFPSFSIIFPSCSHHFPIIFPSFSIISPSFSHHFPSCSHHFSHHFPIMFPSFSIIFQTFGPAFGHQTARHRQAAGSEGTTQTLGCVAARLESITELMGIEQRDTIYI